MHNLVGVRNFSINAVHNPQDIVRNVKFLGFDFTIEPLRDHPLNPQELTIHVRHAGFDNDRRPELGRKYSDRMFSTDPHDLEMDRDTTVITFMGKIKVNEVTEQEIVQAGYRCVLEKIRHEASELFMYNGKAVYNEHLGPGLADINFPMIGSIVENDPRVNLN